MVFANNYRPHPKDGGRYCFQFVCQSTLAGGGYPISGLGRGGTPSQVWGMGYPPPPGTGYPLPPDLGQGTPPGPGTGYPLPPDLGWVPPGPGTGYPPGPGMGYSPWTWDRVPPPGPGMGYPPPDLGRLPPPQHSEHLLQLRAGRYASCVHAGGLSCLRVHFFRILIYLQKPDAIYVAAGSKIFKLDKITGAIVHTYSKGKNISIHILKILQTR